MAPIDPDDVADADDVTSGTHGGRDRDGVASLRDTEAEAGDEIAMVDQFDMDDRAARELGVDLDDRDEPEPGFA